MEIEFHSVCDNVCAKTLSVRYVSSHDQVADALTKPLSNVRFVDLKSKLTVVPSLLNLRGSVKIMSHGSLSGSLSVFIY